MKWLAYTLLLSTVFTVNLRAQTGDKDSSSIAYQAITDARNYRINKADLKQFRKHREAYMAQFSPNRSPFTGPPNIFRNPVTPAGLSRVKDGYNHVDYMAPWFKPTTATTKDTSLLSDSVYVKTFRAAAYKNTTKRRTAGHYIAVYGGVATGVALIVGFFLLLAAMAGG